MCFCQLYLLILLIIAIAAIFGGHFLIKCVLNCIKRKIRKDLNEKKEKLEEKYKQEEKIEGEDWLKWRKKQIFDKERDLDKTSQTPHEEMMAMWMGIFERFMYMFFYLIGYKEFIGMWLVAKIVGNWPDRESGKIDYFLFGTGLSVLIAVIGALIIENMLKIL